MCRRFDHCIDLRLATCCVSRLDSFQFEHFLGVTPPNPADLIGSVSVEEIEFIVYEHHVSDAFMGLILVPLVEKAAEHLTGKVSSFPHVRVTTTCANKPGI